MGVPCGSSGAAHPTPPLALSHVSWEESRFLEAHVTFQSCIPTLLVFSHSALHEVNGCHRRRQFPSYSHAGCEGAEPWRVRPNSPPGTLATMRLSFLNCPTSWWEKASPGSLSGSYFLNFAMTSHKHWPPCAVHNFHPLGGVEKTIFQCNLCLFHKCVFFCTSHIPSQPCLLLPNSSCSAETARPRDFQGIARGSTG